MKSINTRVGTLSTPAGSWQTIAMFLLRIAIGWHLLYEGLIKVITPGWSAKGYLLSSEWIFSDLFRGIAQSDGLLFVTDIINISLLITIGLFLILGIYARIAAFTGAMLILLYYIAHPPFAGMSSLLPVEGNYMFIDKNLVEVFALLVLSAFPASSFPGIDRIRAWFKSKRPYNHLPPETLKAPVDNQQQVPAFSTSRREILKNLVTLPFLGVFIISFLRKNGWFSFEEEAIRKNDSVSGATRVYNFARLEDIRGTLPAGKIGDSGMSRIILGGNLIGGAAHARDLIYVSPLVRKYFTDEKVMETWFIAEQSGINTMSAWPSERTLRVLKEYRRRGGKIQWLGHVDIQDPKKSTEGLKVCVDNGAVGVYVAGDTCDRYIFGGRVDELGQAVDFIKSNKLFAGIACHAIKVPVTCEKNGINADFYMKTIHHDRYWSATPKEQRTVNIRFGDPDFERANNASGHYHDNIWCIDAEETIAFMKDLSKPWIAFKVLAAGAIGAADGFKYAFENGADFIHVGMFDFEIVSNVNIATGILAGTIERIRPWYA